MFTKFNRVLLASGLVLTSLVGFGSSAFAADVLEGGGDVNFELPRINNLTWTQDIATDGSVQALQLHNNFQETKLGTVTVESNLSQGFTVTVESANNGIIQIAGTTDQAYQKMPYTLVYNSKTLDLSDGSDVGVVYGTLQTECASEGGCDADVKISVQGVEGKAAGIYTDTLTFVLSNP
jgi:hypothetical protein